MRVSQNTNYLSFLRDLQLAESASFRAQAIVSSGKSILRPSDDPLASSDILRLTAADVESQQFQKNLMIARSRLETADITLSSVENTVERVRTLALLSIGNNSTGSHYVEEISGLRDQILASANTTHQGTYIFGGSVLRTVPFEKAAGGAVSYQGNSTVMTQQVNRTMQIQMQVPGNEVFLDTIDIFATIDDLVAAMNSGDATAIDAEVRNLEQFAGHLSAMRSRVGSTINVADSVSGALSSSALSRDALRSEIEAANMAEAISELTRAQTNVQATLAVGARLSQLTLLDYLR